MTRPIHDILFKLTDALLRQRVVGIGRHDFSIDVPPYLFVGLVDEGMRVFPLPDVESSFGLVDCPACGNFRVWQDDDVDGFYIVMRDKNGQDYVHMSAHDRMRLAAFRAKQEANQ